MWQWTIKTLIAEPLTLLASVLATGSAFLLVMTFEAIYAGETTQMIAYVRHAEADVWVMQRGVSNMHMASSYLNDFKATEVAGVPGVAAAEPILYINTLVVTGTERWFCYVVGLDTPSRGAGPWAMRSGRAEPAAGEAVVPAVFADMARLELGNSVRISDRDFAVVGLSEGTFSMGNSVVFITKTDLEDIMNSLDLSSYVLVTAEPGVDPQTLALRIEESVDKVSALTAEQFLANDYQMAKQMGAETIAVITLIGSALAVLLVAFTIYSHVARLRSELAVVKALGATQAGLYLCVASQALVITLAGVLVAAGVEVVLAPAATAWIPVVTLNFTGMTFLRTAATGVVVAILAGLISARQVARIDPVAAFAARG